MTREQKLVEEYERLKDRADNLNLYLSYVEHWCMIEAAEILFENMVKLTERYPDGFSADRSLHRAEGDT